MIKPLHDKVIIEEVEFETVSESGLILTGNVNKEIKRARVISIGSDVKLVVPTDIILVDWQQATKSKYEDRVIFVIKESDIIAVFED